ncbi:hypothetical protein D3C72_1837180 [compost metagenome]
MEEAAAAAGSLEEQAQRLRDAIATFRVSMQAEVRPQRQKNTDGANAVHSLARA